MPFNTQGMVTETNPKMYPPMLCIDWRLEGYRFSSGETEVVNMDIGTTDVSEGDVRKGRCKHLSVKVFVGLVISIIQKKRAH